MADPQLLAEKRARDKHGILTGFRVSGLGFRVSGLGVFRV